MDRVMVVVVVMHGADPRIQSRVPREGGRDQLTSESFMTRRVERQTDVGASIIGGWIVDPAVGVDLKHVGRARLVDTKIASTETRRLELDEESGALVTKSVGENRILHRKR